MKYLLFYHSNLSCQILASKRAIKFSFSTLVAMTFPLIYEKLDIDEYFTNNSNTATDMNKAVTAITLK